MSGKFRIVTVLVLLGLLLAACAAPAHPGPRADRSAGRSQAGRTYRSAAGRPTCRRTRESGSLVVGRAGSPRR